MKKLTHEELDQFVENLLEPKEKDNASTVFKQMMSRFEQRKLTNPEAKTLTPDVTDLMGNNGDLEAS